MPKDIIVGINIHNPGYTDTLEQNLDACVEMGMKIIRYNSAFNDDETLKYVKYVADECHKRGLKILLCVDDYRWISRDLRALYSTNCLMSLALNVRLADMRVNRTSDSLNVTSRAQTVLKNLFAKRSERKSQSLEFDNIQ